MKVLLALALGVVLSLPAVAAPEEPVLVTRTLVIRNLSSVDRVVQVLCWDGPDRPALRSHFFVPSKKRVVVRGVVWAEEGFYPVCTDRDDDGVFKLEKVLVPPHPRVMRFDLEEM